MSNINDNAAATDDGDAPEVLWNRWYENARYEMSFRYGVRRIPKDEYKEQYALGCTIQQAARAIAIRRELR